MSIILTSPLPLLDYIVWCLISVILLYLCYRYQYARIRGGTSTSTSTSASTSTPYLDRSKNVPITYSSPSPAKRGHVHERESITPLTANNKSNLTIATTCTAQQVLQATATATATTQQNSPMSIDKRSITIKQKHTQEQTDDMISLQTDTAATIVAIESSFEIGYQTSEQQCRNEQQHYHDHQQHDNHVIQVKPSDNNETEKVHPPYASDALDPPAPLHQVCMRVIISPHPTVPIHLERRKSLRQSACISLSPSPSPSASPRTSQQLSIFVNYCILLVALSSPFRLVCWFHAYYGFDRTAFILQGIWFATSNLRLALLCAAAMRMAYAALDVTFVTLTYSSTPRYLRYPFLIIGISAQFAIIIATVLEITWNKRWPGSFAAVMIGVACATVMIILNISMWIFSQRLNSTELSMDDASRVRVGVEVSRLRRSSVYASCAMFVGMCGSTYITYIELKDLDMEFMQHSYFIPISDWTQVIVCAWMRWYFKAQER